MIGALIVLLFSLNIYGPADGIYKGHLILDEKKIFKSEIHLIDNKAENNYQMFLKIYLGEPPYGEYFVYYYPIINKELRGQANIPMNRGPILSNLSSKSIENGDFKSIEGSLSWPFDGSFHKFEFLQESNVKSVDSLRGIYTSTDPDKKFRLEIHTLKASYDYLNHTSNAFLPYNIIGLVGEKNNKDNNYIIRYSIKKGKYDFVTQKVELMIENTNKTIPVQCSIEANNLKCDSWINFKKNNIEFPIHQSKQKNIIENKDGNTGYTGYIQMFNRDIIIPISWNALGYKQNNYMLNLYWPQNKLAPIIPFIFTQKSENKNFYQSHQLLCILSENSSFSYSGDFYHIQWGYIGKFQVNKMPQVDIFNSNTMDTRLPHGTFQSGNSFLQLHLWLDDEIQIQEGSYYFPLKVTGTYYDEQTKVRLNLINGQFDFFNTEINGELENGQIFWGQMRPNGMNIVLTGRTQKRSKMHQWNFNYWKKIK